MAPERFRGEGDARADVYALGLTLYELLTLRPAFDSPDRLKLIEQIKAEEPTRPRSLDPRIPRDLETIVLKAIDKDPERRYPTADAMAEDLRRFLDDEPILARRDSLAEKIARMARRNPAIASLAAVLFGTLLVVTIGSLMAAEPDGQAGGQREGGHPNGSGRAIGGRHLAQERGRRARPSREGPEPGRGELRQGPRGGGRLPHEGHGQPAPDRPGHAVAEA